MPLFWKNIFKGGGKDNLRRYYLIAGSYLVIVIVLFSVLIIRWSTPPNLELPGFEEGELKNGVQYPGVESPDAPHVAPYIGDENAGTSAGAKTSDVADSDKAADCISDYDYTVDEAMIPTFPPLSGAEADQLEEQEKLTELPLAANPLPRWEVALPFGDYLSTSLPSGGSVHHLSRGVLLRTTPAAPVSAVWDGVVASVSVMDGLYRCSVLIEHTGHIGEYSTFYGNMREIWVKEGDEISRGENIGLMTYGIGREESVPTESTRPVSGRPPTGEEERSLEIRTVWSGYLTDMWQDEGENKPNLPQESVHAVSPSEEGERGFSKDNPLLYLEIRQAGTYLNPLNFITERN